VLPDSICKRILQGWAGSQGVAIAETQITIEPAGFNHVDNLLAGFDAAWLAFANVEGVAARQRGLAVRLLTAEEVGLPGFSALELVARRNRRAEEVEKHETLVSVLEMATRKLRADPRRAVALWREASGNDSEEAARIVEATLSCLKLPIDRTPNRWRTLDALLQEA
jgi:hypothetical protein